MSIPASRSVCLLAGALLAVSATAQSSSRFDPNALYTLHTLFKGKTNVLDVLESGTRELRLRTRNADDPGQYWQLVPLSGNSKEYRLSNALFGKGDAVDVFNGGSRNNYAHMTKVAPFTGQFWTLTPVAGVSNGFRLTTRFRGPGMSLDVINGKNELALARTGRVSGQIWFLTRVELPKQLLYYKFDRGSGTIAVNYGTANVSSTMRSSGSSPWARPGKYGAAMLRGRSAGSAIANCETGFTAGFKGDFTVHWWMKERSRMPTTSTYVFGGMSGFRCFSGGVAGTSLRVRAFGGTQETLMPTVGASLQARTRAKAGVCVGLVVKTVAGKTTAQWYVDGRPHGSSQSLSAAPNVSASTTNFRIGKHTSDSRTSVWDLDEFRLLNRAASAAEISLWCSRATAARGSYGKKNRITLDATGGMPRLGNSAYTHTIRGVVNMPYFFATGLTSTPGFDVGLVFPALKGFTWFPSFDLTSFGTTNGRGEASLLRPVPNLPVLAGVGVDTQVYGVVRGRHLLSNAVSHRMEIE